jgi:hypothetical protein
MELLRLMSKVDPDSARAIYAGLDTTTCVSILRRAALGLGRRPAGAYTRSR